MKVVIGSATLFCGDCLNFLREVPHVGAVVTDPPFNVGKDYGGHNDSMLDADYECWLRSVIEGCNSDQLWVSAPSSKLALFFRILPDAQQVVIPMAAGYAIRNGWTQKYAVMLVSGKPPGNPWNIWDGIRHRGEGYYFREETYGHPGYTPLAIMKRAVVTSGADYILDPFMGTGTSGVAAMEAGKKYFGVEVNPDYFQIACDRIAQAQAQLNLFA